MAFPMWHEVEREHYLQILAYRIDRIAISLSKGNTDQLGCNAWNGLIDELQEAVTTFINEKNNLFIDTVEKKDTKQRKYSEEISKINQQMVNASAEKLWELELLRQSYQTDVKNIREDATGEKNKEFLNAAPDFLLKGQSPVILLFYFTYGFVSTSVSKEEWSSLFASVAACEKPQAELERIQSIAGGDNKMKNIAYKNLNSKDTIHTLSSCMERDDWAHCPLKHPHFCCMPNIKRTTDIAVCVISQTPKDALTYPIFIGEVPGRKEPGSINEQQYKGYTAALQALVFAPREYYWEIPVNVATMYSLKKVPEKDLTSSRNGNPRAMSEMVRDLCRVFFDALINLRMVAEYSAAELYKANYREFLSSALTGGRQTNIHTPCWHVFTPRSAEWNDEQPPPPKKKMNARYSITAAGCAVPVNEETYEYGQLDTAFNRKISSNTFHPR